MSRILSMLTGVWGSIRAFLKSADTRAAAWIGSPRGQAILNSTVGKYIGAGIGGAIAAEQLNIVVGSPMRVWTAFGIGGFWCPVLVALGVFDPTDRMKEKQSSQAKAARGATAETSRPVDTETPGAL